MEPNRFKQNQGLFITSIVSLVISLSLFVFSLYILPHLMWNWYYDIPEFVLTSVASFQENYFFSEASAKIFSFLMFFVPALAIGFISYFTTKALDNKIYNISSAQPEYEVPISASIKESFGFGAKLLIIAILVIIALLFLNWLITDPKSLP